MIVDKVFFERNIIYLTVYLLLVALPLVSAGYNNDDWFLLSSYSNNWIGHGRYALSFWYDYILSGGRALSAQLLFLYAALVLLIESTIFLFKKLEILHDKQIFLFSIISFLSIIFSFGFNELISFKVVISSPVVSFALLYFFIVRSIVNPTLLNIFLILICGLFSLGTYQTFFFLSYFPVLVSIFVLLVSNTYEKKLHNIVSNNIKVLSLVKVTIAFGVALLLYIFILEVIKNYYVFTERGGINNFIEIVKGLSVSPVRLFIDNYRTLDVDTIHLGRVSIFFLLLAFLVSILTILKKVRKDVFYFSLIITLFIYLVSIMIFGLDSALIEGVPVRGHAFTMFFITLLIFIFIGLSKVPFNIKNKAILFLSISLLASSLIVSTAWENTRIMYIGDSSKVIALGGALVAIGSLKNLENNPEIFGNNDSSNGRTTFGNSALYGVNTRKGIFKELLDIDINVNTKENPICGEYPAINSISLSNKLTPVICLKGISKQESLAINACKYTNITNRVSLCEFVGKGDSISLVIKFNKCNEIVKRHIILVEEHEVGRVEVLYRAKTHPKMMTKHKDGGCSKVIMVTPKNINNKITVREFDPRIDIKWIYTVQKNTIESYFEE